jgi:hypothetical protein
MIVLGQPEFHTYISPLWHLGYLSLLADYSHRDLYFICKLQDHLLGRILNLQFDGDTHGSFTDETETQFGFEILNTVYRLRTMRVNYTTYDMRRDYDTINPRTHPFVMVLSPETEQGPILFGMPMYVRDQTRDFYPFLVNSLAT